MRCCLNAVWRKNNRHSGVLVYEHGFLIQVEGRGNCVRDVLLVCLVILLAVDIGIIFFSITRYDRKRASCFTILCGMVLVYTLGYVAELYATTADAARVALVVENFSIPGIPGFFLLTYISMFLPMKYRLWYNAAATAYGLIFFIIVLTNGLHQLYYTSVEMVFSGGHYFVKLGRGPLYFVNQAVAVVLMVATYISILLQFVRGSKKLRRQMIYLIIGSLVSFIANLLNFSGLLPTGLDPTPFALTLGLAFFSISVIVDDLMDVVVQARNTAVETMDDAFIVLDNDADFLYCNQSAVDIFPALEAFQGTEPISGLENWPSELTSLQQDQQAAFSLSDENGVRHYRATVRKISGEWGEKPVGMSVVIHDTTEETLLFEKLEQLASTDPLTDILNRRRFFEMAQRELGASKRKSETTALIMFDIDYFKKINDNYGHDIGDIALKKVASTVCGQLREYDIFGRIGGEEFAIFTQSPGREGLLSFVSRLRKAIEDLQVECETGSIRLTASFGIYEIPPGGKIEDAFKKADLAMYRAKAEGRNKVRVYCPDPA